MSGQTMYRGGWGSAPLSDEARRTVAELEAREAQAANSAEIAEAAWRAHNGVPDDAQRRAAWEENNTRLAVRMAAEEGVSPLEVHRGNWGHTKAEAVALAGAQMDVEDRQREARQRKAFLDWQRDNAEYEQEPTRAERIAESREARERAWLEEHREKVEARRADRAREAEIRRVAGKQLEPVIGKLLREIDRGRS
jgi:hypothetical protein